MEKKNLIVVTNKKTEKYGNFLRGLVSQNDDTDDVIVGTKDGEVVLTIYNEKQFADRKKELSSNQRILFIGNSKLVKEECQHFKVKYNQYGMVFSSLGKQACMYVDHVVPMKEYDEFIKMAGETLENIKKVSVGGKDVAQVAAGAAAGAAAGVGFGLGTAAVLRTALIATSIVSVTLMPVVKIGTAAVLAGGAITSIKYNAKKKEIEQQQYDCLVMKCYLEYLSEFLN